MIAYKTSKDYKHLIELLDKGIEVVCFYTYVWNECDKDRPGYEKIMVTDVCTAKLLNKGTQDEQYVISCRGTGFLHYWTKDMPYSYTFEELLKARDIEYIEPDSIINNSLQEEPVSEDLEEAAYKFVMDNFGNPKEPLYKFDQRCFKAGAKWLAEQFEKERLKHCDELTTEQAQIESDFVTQHLKENNRTPTFIDAIKYGRSLKEKEMQSAIELAEDHAMLAGMEKMKKEMMAKAIDARCFGFQDDALFSFRLPSDNYLVGSEVKVIVIKED